MLDKNKTTLFLSITLIVLLISFLSGLYINRNGLMTAINQIGTNVTLQVK